MLDLEGYPKDAAFYWKAQFVPGEALVHIAPHSWKPAAQCEIVGL